jgi:hypothetical protein
MMQEAITYMLIGSAITLAVYKVYLKFRKKKPEKTFGSDTSIKMQGHNCSDCSAECMLRNETQSVLLKNKNTCDTTRSTSKPF